MTCVGLMTILLQMLNKAVEHGLGVIYNCSSLPSLRPAVSEQALSTLSLYLDPDTNDPDRVIHCIRIMELLKKRDQLYGQDWPDSILQAVSGLLARARYDQELQDFRASTNQDGSGISISANGIMRCLIGISRSPGGSCQVLNLLVQHQDKLADILRNSSEAKKYCTKELFQSLYNHSCTQCTDREWITELLNQGV